MKISRRHSTNIPDDQIRQRAVDLGKHRWAEDGVGRTVEFIENYISSGSQEDNVHCLEDLPICRGDKSQYEV